ncbi:MAG TPA: ParA family protein [Gemmatales bacterium]|nr:ParA family protein [Gemmatales bacterium]
MPGTTPRTGPVRLAFWYGKGGVGKSTTTILLALSLARHGDQVLVIDLDPECGTSRDFVGKKLLGVQDNLKSFLESDLLTPPPIIATGIEGLAVTPCPPDEQRFFRYFPEHSSKLADSLSLIGPDLDYILMDVPNQFDNIVELGLIAAEHVVLPVELTADCVERLPTVLRIITEAKAVNPNLKILGALALAATPSNGHKQPLSAKERLIYDEYDAAFQKHGIKFFKTLMYRSATTVEEARSSADLRYLHWTARRRFNSLLNEIKLRITSPLSYGTVRNPQSRSKATEAVA